MSEGDNEAQASTAALSEPRAAALRLWKRVGLCAVLLAVAALAATRATSARSGSGAATDLARGDGGHQRSAIDDRPRGIEKPADDDGGCNDAAGCDDPIWNGPTDDDAPSPTMQPTKPIVAAPPSQPPSPKTLSFGEREASDAVMDRFKRSRAGLKR